MVNKVAIHFYVALRYYLKNHETLGLIHGPPHWVAVYDNCLKLDPTCDSKTREMYAIFAFFHDAARTHDGQDNNHGNNIVKKFTFPTPIEYAIAEHTFGEITKDLIIGICWDADRLDLVRVGIKPDAKFMSTEAGRQICQRNE